MTALAQAAVQGMFFDQPARPANGFNRFAPQRLGAVAEIQVVQDAQAWQR